DGQPRHMPTVRQRAHDPPHRGGLHGDLGAPSARRAARRICDRPGRPGLSRGSVPRPAARCAAATRMAPPEPGTPDASRALAGCSRLGLRRGRRDRIAAPDPTRKGWMNDPETARRLFFEALDFFDSADYANAESRLREALTFAPDNASILTNLSTAALRQDK